MERKTKRTIVLLLYLLLLLLSIGEIVTTSQTLHSKSYQGNTASGLWTGTEWSDFWTVWDIAPGTSYASIYATLSAGLVNIPATIAGAASYPNSDIKATYVGIVTSAASFIVATIALVWSFVAAYTSDKAYHGPFPAPGRPKYPGFLTVGERGSFSVEAYTCQTIDLHFPSQRGQTHRTCAFAQSSRWLTIPMFITSVILLIVWAIKLRRGRQEKRESEALKMASMRTYS